jgi:hypothetical protein
MKLRHSFENETNILQDTGNSRLQVPRRMLASILAVALFFTSCPEALLAHQDPPASAPQDASAPTDESQTPARAPQSPEQLQQLVAPIALYPDSLVAQILAASTYPEQVVEADRWVQSNPNLKGDDLAQAVDQQNWDPSVKALTAFPSVLANMDKNISWTSSLGDAYYNQGQDVMDVVQAMRQRAEEAGNLKSTPQQEVATQGSTIVIQPADPTVVYVPAYDPWVIYGGPIAPWPGWYPVPGIWFGGPYLSFGVGFGVGFYGGYGWGWSRWGFDWGHRSILYNHGRYYSRSAVFYNRNSFYRGGRGGVYGRPGVSVRPFNGDARSARGYPEARGGVARPGVTRGVPSGTRSGAFSDYGRGGQVRGEASRGSVSMGGRGGGGGHHR